MDWKYSLVDQRTRSRNQPRLSLKWRCSCQHRWSGHRENIRTRDSNLHHDPEDEDSRQLHRVRHKRPWRGIFDLELSPWASSIRSIETSCSNLVFLKILIFWWSFETLVPIV